MAFLAASAGLVMIMLTLWEGFETMILPRRVTRRFRFSRFLFRISWRLWKAVVIALVPRRLRETWLSVYGPLALLFLMVVWAAGLIIGFALLHLAAGLSVRGAVRGAGLTTNLYFSGTTFFTLGLGDIVPKTTLERFLTVIESGMGFGFLALVISYLPALNQSFARREVSISLLDARAGSPPSASEMLRRHSDEHGMEALRQMLQEWERWSAEFLESHLSYPMLAYFRSQHDNQSWLGALTAILDTCSLAMAGLEGGCECQAELTFAMARHAVVDLCLVFRTPPKEPVPDRLPLETKAELRAILNAAELKFREGEAFDERLSQLRQMYEPYAHALAAHFYVKVPPWVAAMARPDNWQMSAWERGPSFRRTRRRSRGGGEHF